MEQATLFEGIMILGTAICAIIGALLIVLGIGCAIDGVKTSIARRKLREWQIDYSGRVTMLLSDLLNDHIIKGAYPEVHAVITQIEKSARALNPICVSQYDIRDILKERFPRENNLSQAAVEEYIAGLNYSPETPDATKTYVAGNIRGFYAWLQRGRYVQRPFKELNPGSTEPYKAEGQG